MRSIWQRKASRLEEKLGDTQDRLTQALGVLSQKSGMNDISALVRTLEIAGADLNSDMSKLQTGAGKIWATFRSCHLVGHRVMSADWRAKEETIGKEGKELLALLNDPNPYHSRQELFYLLCFHLKLTGKAFWLKDNKNLKGKPETIWPLYPQFVTPIWDKSNGIVGFDYKVNGNITRFDADEVMYFKRPHPVIPTAAIGEIEGGKETMLEYMDKAEFKERFIRNGAQPSGVLIKEDAEENDTKWRKFKSWFQAEYGGKENAGKTAFLSGKWKYTQLGVTIDELANVAREKQNVGFIFLAHGVPLSVAGLEKAANLSVSFQDELNFRSYECVPVLDMIEGKINKELAPAFNIQIAYELEGLIDVQKIVSDWTPLVDRGAMTRNDLREKAGLPKGDHPMLDEYLIPAGMVPLDFVGFSDPNAEKSLRDIHRRISTADRERLRLRNDIQTDES